MNNKIFKRTRRIITFGHKELGECVLKIGEKGITIETKGKEITKHEWSWKNLSSTCECNNCTRKSSPEEDSVIFFDSDEEQ